MNIETRSEILHLAGDGLEYVGHSTTVDIGQLTVESFVGKRRSRDVGQQRLLVAYVHCTSVYDHRTDELDIEERLWYGDPRDSVTPRPWPPRQELGGPPEEH
ncbi:MAG: hypothetical protein LC687_06250 [Actinobacteria bacterium]|nr:hypothetical protein [Actinomycetota bacterium]